MKFSIWFLENWWAKGTDGRQQTPDNWIIWRGSRLLTSTHTLLWSTKIITSKRTQTLISRQSNDLIKVRLYYFLDYLGMLTTRESISFQVKRKIKFKCKTIYLLQLQKMLQNKQSSRKVSKFAYKGINILHINWDQSQDVPAIDLCTHCYRTNNIV